MLGQILVLPPRPAEVVAHVPVPYEGPELVIDLVLPQTLTTVNTRVPAFRTSASSSSSFSPMSASLRYGLMAASAWSAAARVTLVRIGWSSVPGESTIVTPAWQRTAGKPT